ncbi:MAG: hypothetical protein LC650_03990 [Actinobacteria bacterium]|nr:hypothetical protein [Actinomycetota bacterium]
MYKFLTVSFVMRDCETHEDAIRRLAALLPQYPDENTEYMESWEILASVSPDGDFLDDGEVIEGGGSDG